MNTTATQLPTDQPVDLSLSRILFIDDQNLDAQILQALALLQQPKHYLRISIASELLAQLHQATWDLIVYGHCEALTLAQSLQHIQEAAVFRIPLLIALPQAPQSQDFAHFLSMIRHGVFDLLRLDQVDHIQASLLRALKYSYALQRAYQLQQQLKQMQKLNHLLHLQLNHARALIQDGIHIQANPAYLHLFGLHKQEQVLGKLLIDLLQPQQHAEFEQHVQQLYLENRAWRHLRIHSLNPALKFAPELDIICIAQPDVTKLEIYILPTALLHTPPQLPNTQPIQPVQFSLSTATSPAVNDQCYDTSRRFAPSAKAPPRSQPSTPISALKQHDFDIARLDLACSEILNLAQSEQPKQSKQPALKLYFQQLHNISRKNQPHPHIVAVRPVDSAQQHITLEAASQQPFRRLDLQQQPDPEAIHSQKATRPSQYQLDALIPEQSYIQRLTQSIQIDRELLCQSCQQLTQLPPEHQPCMLMLQLQHQILLHDPDFAHMLIHAQNTLNSHNQPVLILEFDANALLRQHDQALKRLALLRQCGVLIALRNAQPSAELEALLQATSISLLSFTDQFNADLVHPPHAPARLQQLQDFRKISNFKILIKNLHQQDSFERAATLDVDFLQGDYFQAKQDQLTLIEQIQHS